MWYSWTEYYKLIFNDNPIMLFPLAAFISLILAFTIPYILAVVYQHAGFMEIFDIVDLEPSNTCFCILMNLATIFIFIVVIIRYQYAALQMESIWYSYRSGRCLNKATIIFGYIITFCILIIANFRYSSLGRIIGIFGLFMFVFPIPYMILSTILFQMLNWADGCSRRVNATRICLCVIHVLAALLYLVFGINWLIHLRHATVTDTNDWSKDAKYYWYQISVISEYVMGYVFAIFLLTHMYEFQMITVEFSSSYW